MREFIFAYVLMGLAPSFAQTGENCVTTCESYKTCTRCLETCNQCLFTYVADPDVTNVVVNRLPLEFNYSKEDPNSSNATCSSTKCGSKTCTGTTTDANKTLPAAWTTSACTMTPSNTLPAKISCRYKDFYCAEYCAAYESYECCAEYKTTCQ